MKLKIVSILLGLSVLLIGWSNDLIQSPVKLSGVNRANEYLSITSVPSSANTRQLKTDSGSLGSVIITGSSAGDLILYNATTSNVSLRTLATSSLTILAAFPVNTAVGTYIFDSVATDGLLAVFSGTQGTTTITYR